MIRALVFDCFGVLYWDDLNRLYNLVSPDKFQDINDIIHACDHGYITQEDFLNQVAALADISVEAVVAVIHAKQRRNEPMIERLRALKKDYKIGLLTNMGPGTLDTVFDETERAELFDVMVISSEVGMIKPSRDIFELTSERLGVPASETVFIDDRPVNTDGAERTGMQTILFTTNKQFDIELDRLTEGQ
ncbi:MAG: HAD family phosphatase [Candidatus Saccharimonadales bacterium]|jgi:putative hydrolase of the HAD superfamily|nr:glucose-phosphatase [Patescibacteria group bacterium]